MLQKNVTILINNKSQTPEELFIQQSHGFIPRKIL